MWCSHKRKRGLSGYIYVATSNILNAAKIGMWRGSIDNLKKRYTTPYGPTLQIHTAVVDDCVGAEALLHKQFQHRNLGGELFEKQFILEYIDALGAL